MLTVGTSGYSYTEWRGPFYPASLPPPICLATSPVGYGRFHGRNAAAWRHHATAAGRSSYAHRPEELASWAARLRQLAAETESC